MGIKVKQWWKRRNKGDKDKSERVYIYQSFQVFTTMCFAVYFIVGSVHYGNIPQRGPAMARLFHTVLCPQSPHANVIGSGGR